LGCIDLAEYDGKTAFVSILIFSLDNRRKGFGTEALRLLLSYCKSLGLETLFAIIQIENSSSKNLFEKMGFVGESSTLYRKQLR
jgi:diamine N-acetyltransferase